MNLHLENKVALVTGSTAGIGFAIAAALAAEGARVIVNGRSEKRVQDALSAILERHPRQNWNRSRPTSRRPKLHQAFRTHRGSRLDGRFSSQSLGRRYQRCRRSRRRRFAALNLVI